jgi:hypothetical protein
LKGWTTHHPIHPPIPELAKMTDLGKLEAGAVAKTDWLLVEMNFEYMLFQEVIGKNNKKRSENFLMIEVRNHSSSQFHLEVLKGRRQRWKNERLDGWVDGRSVCRQEGKRKEGNKRGNPSIIIISWLIFMAPKTFLRIHGTVLGYDCMIFEVLLFISTKVTT